MKEPTQQISFEGRDGHTIHGYTWMPEDPSKMIGIVLIIHGMAEHALRYSRLAAALNEAGFGVYAHDQRGHGITAEIPEDMGFFAVADGWRLLIHDVYVLERRVQEQHPDLPVFMVGHSMGSFVTQQFLADHGGDLAGAALSASVDHAGLLRSIGLGIARVETWRLGQKGRSKLLHSMSFGDYNKPFKPNRTEYDWLSRDEAEVDIYQNDPLCGFISTTQMWCDLLEGLGEMARPATRKRVPDELPLYLLTGSMDPVTRMGKATQGLADAYKHAGSKDVTLKIYAGARHECFNETNRDEVANDLIAWLKSKATAA